jgi:hypothetical protein
MSDLDLIVLAIEQGNYEVNDPYINQDGSLTLPVTVKPQVQTITIDFNIGEL